MAVFFPLSVDFYALDLTVSTRSSRLLPLRPIRGRVEDLQECSTPFSARSLSLPRPSISRKDTNTLPRATELVPVSCLAFSRVDGNFCYIKKVHSSCKHIVSLLIVFRLSQSLLIVETEEAMLEK